MPPNDKNPPGEFDDNQGQVVESANPPPPGGEGGVGAESAAPSDVPPGIAEAVADLDTEDFDYSVFESSIPGEIVGESAPPAPTSPEAPPQAAAPAEAPAPSPVEPAAAPPAAAPQQAAEPAKVEATPASPAQPVEPPPPTSEAPAADGFTALDQAIQASRDKVIETVAAGTYQLSQAELESIQVEPEKVIPTLLAKVHVNAVQGVVRHISQQMPALVSALIQAREQTTKLESDFFKAWPQLDKAKHGSDIMKVGQVFRQLNPNATYQEFVKHVGAQVVIAHGLHVQQAPQQAPQQAQAARPPAFQPAGIGRTSAPAAPSTPKNPWEEMVEIMNE